MPPDADLVVVATATTCITFILTSAWLLRSWLDRRAKGPTPAALLHIDERLAHMERAIDAVAIEVERISEGQRFTTKLLAERNESPAATRLRP